MSDTEDVFPEYQEKAEKKGLEERLLLLANAWEKRYLHLQYGPNCAIELREELEDHKSG